MDSQDGNIGGRVSRLRKLYIDACIRHDTGAAHAIVHVLHNITGAYTPWERHIDGGHSA